MTFSKQRALEEIVPRAARLLAQTAGNVVRLEDGESLFSSQRFQVFRFQVMNGSADAPASVIVKVVNVQEGEEYDPERVGSGPAWRLFNEWAGLDFLGRVAAEKGVASPAPRLYAGDREGGFIVLEDLGDGASLADLFWDSDALTTENALIEMARAQGRLHALTIGRQEEFERLRIALGVFPSSVPAEDGGYQDFVAVFQEMTEALNVKPVTGAENDLHALCDSFQMRGPFWAYCHRDSCPTNCLPVSGQARLIDFEAGGYGHALLDAVYGRVPFPPCFEGHRLPELLPPRMEAAYRTELRTGCPEAEDDTLFYPALVEACAWWNLALFQRWTPPLSALLHQDRDYGSSTARRRALIRMVTFARTTQEFGHLEALGASFAAMVGKMRALWPHEAEDLPCYPAFQRGGYRNIS